MKETGPFLLVHSYTLETAQFLELRGLRKDIDAEERRKVGLCWEEWREKDNREHHAPRGRKRHSDREG